MGIPVANYIKLALVLHFSHNEKIELSVGFNYYTYAQRGLLCSLVIMEVK